MATLNHTSHFVQGLRLYSSFNIPVKNCSSPILKVSKTFQLLQFYCLKDVVISNVLRSCSLLYLFFWISSLIFSSCPFRRSKKSSFLCSLRVWFCTVQNYSFKTGAWTLSVQWNTFTPHHFKSNAHYPFYLPLVSNISVFEY